MAKNKPCAETIWRVLSTQTGLPIHGTPVVGNDKAKLLRDVARLLALQSQDITLEDTGETKPCCKDCGKK